MLLGPVGHRVDPSRIRPLGESVCTGRMTDVQHPARGTAAPRRPPRPGAAGRGRAAVTGRGTIGSLRPTTAFPARHRPGTQDMPRRYAGRPAAGALATPGEVSP